MKSQLKKGTSSQQYFKTVIQLCLLKSSPEVLPYSKIGLTALIMIHFFLRWGMLTQFPNAEMHNLFAVSVMWIGASLALVYFALLLRHHADRWFKVTLGLLSVELVFLVLIKVASTLLVLLSLTSLGALLVYGVFIWTMLAKSHVIQKGLDCRFLTAILTILAIELLSNLPVVAVFFEAIEQMTAGG